MRDADIDSGLVNPVIQVGCDGVMSVIQHQSMEVLSEAGGVSRL